MTTVDCIYFDSAPVIYYLDIIFPYKPIIEQIITDCIRNHTQVISSTLLNAEYLVMPYRQHNLEKVIAYADFKTCLQMEIIQPSDVITTIAAQLRAKYKGLKEWMQFILQRRCIVDAMYS